MGHIIVLNNNRLLSVEKHREWKDSRQYLAKVKTVSVLCLQIWRVKRETLDSFSTTLGSHAEQYNA